MDATSNRLIAKDFEHTTSGTSWASPPRKLVWGIVVAAGFLLVVHSAARRPADPGEPLLLHAREHLLHTPRATLRVGTFNIHGGKGTDGKRDLQRTADCLRDLDFVALQEVRGSVVGLPKIQAGVLGRELQMAWIFAPTQRAKWHERFGNAVLTRLPLTSFLRIPLVSTGYHRPRNAVFVNLLHNAHTVHVLAAHVDNLRDREQQLRAVADLFLALEEPALLLGDLNADASHPEIRRLLATPGVVDAFCSAPGASRADRHIDWILVRGLRVLSAESFDNGASDHPRLRAELEIAPGAKKLVLNPH